MIGFDENTTKERALSIIELVDAIDGEMEKINKRLNLVNKAVKMLASNLPDDENPPPWDE